MLPKALKCCPKSKISPNLVTLITNPSDSFSRSVGTLAESLLVTQPKSSVAEVTGLLGITSVDLRNHREYPKLNTSPTDQKTGVKLIYREHEKIFHPEQLVAFVLSQLKKIVAEDSENRLNEANSNYYVLSAPNYSTDVERAALLDAARSVSTNNNCFMFLNGTILASFCFLFSSFPRHKSMHIDKSIDGVLGT